MAKEFIEQFKNNPAGLQKALGKLYQSALNQMLDAEMDDHLGRDRYERKKGNSNTRNGYRQKPVQSEVGELGIRVPRDRKGTFEPIVVPNGGSITEQLEETILRIRTSPIQLNLPAVSNCVAVIDRAGRWGVVVFSGARR